MFYLGYTNVGSVHRGEHLSAELSVYADATDLEQVRVWSALPMALVLYYVPDDGTYFPESHTVAWLIESLPWGTSTTLRFEGWITTELDFGDELCVSVTLESASPLETWTSDDPDSVGDHQPSCIVLR